MTNPNRGGGQCVFCGNSPTTREHVVPQWLGEIFPTEPPVPVEDRVPKTIVRFELGREWNEQRGRPGPQQTSTVKVVCATCNNGWMSESTRGRRGPYLVDMMVGSGTFDQGDLSVVERWAVKTAMMLEYDHPQSLVSTQPMRDQVRAGGTPGEAVVMIGTRATGRPVHLTHLGLGIGRAKSPGPLPVPHNFAKTTLAFGRVVLVPWFVTDADLMADTLPELLSYERFGLRPIADCAGKTWPFQPMTADDYKAVIAGY